MITLSKSGNTVTFTFDENSGYLQNGTIDVPVNSLSLILDESDMATFRKSASNDIFVSARYEEFGMTKAELEAWYKENMVGSTGGGVDSGTVQTMIDESISGKADSSAVTQEISAAVSGKQDTLTAGRGIDISANTISFDLPISAGTGTNSLIMSGSGNTASGDYSVAYGKLNSASGECSTANGNRNTANNFAEFSIGQKNVSRTEDSSAFGHSGNTLFSVGNGIINEEQGIDANHNAFEVRGNGEIYISDTNAAGSYYQKPMINLQDTLNGKQDTLSAGTNITISGNVISAEGGGKAIEAGRGITVTTGETADTVSFNLPISAGTGTNSVREGSPFNVASHQESHAEGHNTTASQLYTHAEGVNTVAKGRYSHAEGQDTTANTESTHTEGYKAYGNGYCSHAEGSNTNTNGYYSHAEGYYTKTNNESEHASGRYNKSNTGSTTSAQTLFSVGNGTSDNARHNAFEIRKNGDIYLSLNGQDVKLQDQLGGGVTPQEFSAYTASTESRLAEDEEVTAAGINAVNDKFGGLSLVKLTQAQYDALAVKDNNVLYIIIN